MPPSLTVLIVNAFFNHPVDHLPPSLTHLVLGDGVFYSLVIELLLINLLIISALASSTLLWDLALTLGFSLVHLSIAGKYDHPLPSFPSTLTHIRFSNRGFNQPINSLPPNLMAISLGYSFNHSLPLPLPHYLRIVEVRSKFKHENSLPVNFLRRHIPPFGGTKFVVRGKKQVLIYFVINIFISAYYLILFQWVPDQHIGRDCEWHWWEVY